MNKHTPGPWHIMKSFTGTVWAGSEDEPTIISDMSTLGDKTAEANARLIAAAPELLAVLIEAESAMTSHNLSRKHEGHECPWDFAEGFGGCLDKVRAAIAKATGAKP